MVVDPERLDDRQGFGAAVGEYIECVRASRPAHGVDKVLVPGDPERMRRAEALEKGVSVPAAVLAEIVATAEGLGIEAGDLSA